MLDFQHRFLNRIFHRPMTRGAPRIVVSRLRIQAACRRFPVLSFRWRLGAQRSDNLKAAARPLLLSRRTPDHFAQLNNHGLLPVFETSPASAGHAELEPAS